MEDRYYLLIAMFIIWLVFYFLVGYSLDKKYSSFHKFAFFTVINGMFILICFILLSVNIELQKEVKYLKAKIENYDK